MVVNPISPISKPARRGQQGFTLIELMIVMVIIGVLAAIAVPAYVQSVRHAREAVLKEDLHTLRAAIDSYTVDKGKAPQALSDLVDAGSCQYGEPVQDVADRLFKNPGVCGAGRAR